MSDHRLSLPFWEGFTAAQLDVQDEVIWITLRRDPQAAMVCGGCGTQCYQVHDAVTRIVRELPMQGNPVRLRVPLRRLKCDVCGTRTERISWLDRHARVTRALAEFVVAWCAKLPVAHVCKLSGLHWGTVRQIERAGLERQLAALPVAQPTRLVMDEFALFRRVLWVGEGRSRDAIRPFFESLGPQRCAGIQAVAMDMNTAFDLEVRRHCRNARVVYDLFHVIAKYGREVIDHVRVDEANRLREDRPQRKVIKGARWLLLRNEENVPPTQQATLDELLAANQALMTVYLMKATLKELWQTAGGWQWLAAWRNWLKMARDSGIEPLRKFAAKLKPYWRGIAARLRWPMHTGQLEGINNRIKVMKRMAYGCRDSGFFFLKIKAAFPGNP